MQQVMKQPATPRGLAAGRGSGQGTAAVSGGQEHSITPGVALEVWKRSRWCTIAKLVTALPLGETALAMPYRHRQTVNHVSIPPVVLRYARERGARRWLVRLDTEGVCYTLPLADVERLGWLKPSDGQPEWFVPLGRFRPIAWQDWEYVEAVVRLLPEQPAARQLPLW